MFWGVTLETGKRYSQTVDASYHCTMAALEPQEKEGKKNFVSVWVEQDKQEFLLCTLKPDTTFQVPLDLIFVEGQEVAFFLNGEGTVHLTGYVLPDEEDYGMDAFGEEEDDSEEVSELSDEEEPEKLTITAGQKRKIEPQVNQGNKKAKPAVEAKAKVEPKPAAAKLNGNAKVPAGKAVAAKVQAAESSDESDDDEEGDEQFKDIIANLKKARDAGGAAVGSDSDEDEEDDDEDESDDDSDDETIMKVQQNKIKANLGKGQPQKGSPQKQVQTPKPGQQGGNKPGQQPNSAGKQPFNKGGNKTPNQNQFSGKKGGPNQGGKPGGQFGNKGTPGGPNRSPNQSFGNKGGNQKDDSAEKKPQNQKLDNGLILTDLRAGSGPECRKGKLVHVNYVGRLANNKEFDRSHKPFSFRLGQGEVIQGWDIGLEGMKVGGKRRIVVPAKLGYGNRKQGPIPANSELHFDVELKAVS